MKTILSSLIWLALLALASVGPLHAVEPAESPTKGRVLILKNEHTMEGDIERVGDRYRVRRATGETWIPADRVLSVVSSLPDAYGYLRKRANLDDADERLRLANWCRLNGLREQALVEVQAAVQLRPDHAPTRRLLEYLRQAAQVASAPKPSAPVERSPGANALPPVEVTSESLGLFATRVQPILMNTCARCHATGKGGNFRLTQVYEDSIGNRRTLEQNLAAVLAQINLNQPEASRLLAKAVSDHAHVGQAPLRDRKAAPYRTLEHWIKLTVDNNPHLRDSLPNGEPGASATGVLRSLTLPARQQELRSLTLPARQQELRSLTLPARQQERAEETHSQWGVDGQPSAALQAPAPQPASSGPVAVSNMTAAPPPPPPPAAPADPYDPEVFNRQAHPEVSKPVPGK